MHVWSKAIDPMDFLSDGMIPCRRVYNLIRLSFVALTDILYLYTLSIPSFRVLGYALAHRLCFKALAAKEKEIGQGYLGHD